MRRDATVWAVGEDLGRGGVFGQYKGLVEEFGPERIADAPISEACIMGAAVGAAMMGTRPIVELRFSDFALCAIDELVNQAAKARYMFGGQGRVPLVVREPIGMWRSSAAQHSQSLEGWYTHIPGLVVVAPSTPADNKGLLKAAIRCDDPVVYLEHKNLWPLEGDVPDGDHVVEIGKARVARAGQDLTIVSWSAAVHTCLAAAETLAKERHRRRGDRPEEPVAVGQGGGAGERREDGPAAGRARGGARRRLRRRDRGDGRRARARQAQGAGEAPRRAARADQLCAQPGGSGARDG